MNGPQLVVSQPATNAAAVTPSNSDTIPETRGLYVGAVGDVKVDLVSSGTAITFVAVPTGTILPIGVTRVYSTGTSASNIVALW